MKLTRRILRKIILSEILDKDAPFYDYELAYQELGPGDPLFEYEFFTKDGLLYLLKIEYMPTEDGIGKWDIEFDASDVPSDQFRLTGSFDLKVLSTVTQIVKDFVVNVRPGLPETYNKITNFTCIARQEKTIDGQPDRRRERIYRYILRKQGIPSVKVTTDAITGNIIMDFVIP
jgi:hypothetical protein